MKIGHFPDIKKRCPGNGQFLLSLFRTSKIGVRDAHGHFLLAIFRTSTFDVREMASFHWPYSRHQISHKIDVRNTDNDVGDTDNDVRDTESDVHKMDKIPVLIPDRENCPCPGHQSLMSGTWTENTVHVPDINF